MFNHLELVETTNQLKGFCVLTLLAIYEWLKIFFLYELVRHIMNIDTRSGPEYPKPLYKVYMLVHGDHPCPPWLSERDSIPLPNLTESLGSLTDIFKSGFNGQSQRKVASLGDTAKVGLLLVRKKDEH